MVESIQLMRQIAVKALVTENFKIQIGNELKRNLEQLEAELQQLEFKGKRAIADLEKKALGTPELPGRIEAVRSQMEAEKLRLEQLKEDMQGQVRKVSELPIGGIVTQFNIETPVEIRVGENIFQRLEGGEILIRDGIVEQINT